MKGKIVVFAVLLSFVLPPGAIAQVPAGGGNIRFEPNNAATVVFNHERHIAANDRKCSRCHFGIFVMEKGSHKMNMTMITKGHFCGACHNGKQAFDVADKAHCARCHR
jgi:c(7)-type cytochrome triheme protein